MGLGIGAILSLAVGAASTIAQVRASNKARGERAEQRAIATASEQQKNIRARRQQAKRLRVTRARIAQSAANTGVSGSSGALGAQSALTASTGASIAQQQSEILAVQGINASRSREADALSRGARAGAFGNLFQQGIGFAEEEGLLAKLVD